MILFLKNMQHFKYIIWKLKYVHYTRLSNALLYALGYKVLNISGYYSDDDNEFGFGNLHACSLIKLKENKSYPFYSTLDVFPWKLNVGNVFRMICNKTI